MHYIACAWYKRRQRLRRATLTQDAIALEKSPTETAARGGTDNHLRESLDCPDCFDTMLKFYDWDKMKYICENCGLTIANSAILSTYVSSEVRN
jgi:ribosomal protein S27E